MKVEKGAEIPSWTMDRVTPERMRTVAAIFRDPNPVHWDSDFVKARGGGDRVINQSPINVSYIVNMLMDWAGPESVRRLRVQFPGAVFEGEKMTARGVVDALSRQESETLAHCKVWLEAEDGRRTVEGTAVVVVSRG